MSVKVNRINSKFFEIKRGPRKGDIVSIVLFNLALENITKDHKLNKVNTLLNKTHQVMAHADDVVLLLRSRSEVKEITENLIEGIKRFGLEITEENIKSMELRNDRKEKENGNLHIM